MVSVRIESKPAFCVAGRSVFITGQDNEQFADFWRQSHENGLVERLKAFGIGDVTGSSVIGLSHTEKDPQNRAFDFTVCAETTGDISDRDLEQYSVPAQKWAIFSADGNENVPALIEAEMYCHLEWLPTSGYRHALAPEIETYPASGGSEYWLPIE